VVNDWPQVLEYDPQKRANPLGYRLMRYYPVRARGVNVFKMSDGTYIRDDQSPGEPYPATDAPVEGVIAVSWYSGVATRTELNDPHVLHIYYGGHAEVVTSAEAALLAAAGFGGYLT
jgi:hypothetical protein